MNSNFSRKRVFHAGMNPRLALIGLLLCTASPGQTSADNPRLKTALERYPEADSDKDGILTLEEAKAFKDKHSKERGKGGGMAPQGGERHVYKKTGTTE